MDKKQAREEAESRISGWIDNAFYDDDGFLANNPAILKEMQKARNRCLKVLGYEKKAVA